MLHHMHCGWSYFHFVLDLLPCNTLSVSRGDNINLSNLPTWFTLWWLCISFLWVETFPIRGKCIKTRKGRKQLRSLEKVHETYKIHKDPTYNYKNRKIKLLGWMEEAKLHRGGPPSSCRVWGRLTDVKNCCRLYRKRLHGCGLLNLPVLNWAFGLCSCLWVILVLLMPLNHTPIK